MITYVQEEYQVDNTDIINNHINFVVTTSDENVLFMRLYGNIKQDYVYACF